MTKKQQQFANMEDMMPLIRESLATGQKVRILPRGKSMLPLLREGKDSVVLSPVTAPLQAYDLILYQRADGKYVLHRIVAVDRRGSYVCMGDHQLIKEYGVTSDQVIAVVTEFYRGSRHYVTANKGYRLYVHLWYQARRGVRLARRLIKKFPVR